MSISAAWRHSMVPLLSPPAVSNHHTATENPANTSHSDIQPDTTRYKKTFCQLSGPELSPDIEQVASGICHGLVDGEWAPFVLEPDCRSRGIEDDWREGPPHSQRPTPPHYGPCVQWECCEGEHAIESIWEPPQSPESPGYVPGRARSVYAPRDPSALLSFDEERLVFSDVPEVVWWSGEVEGCQEDVRGEIALVLFGLFVCWWLAGGFCW